MSKKEYQCKYNKNDLVYAKIRGYPWWPGIIGEIKLKPGENGEKKFELLVNFIGDHSHSMVNEDKLQKFHVKEIDFKNKKRKKLMQSIQIANDIHNGKYTYEEWRNKDKKKNMQQKKSKQGANGKEKKSLSNDDSNSEDGNTSDDQRDSDGEDEEYGPITQAKSTLVQQAATGSPHLQSNPLQTSQQSKSIDNKKNVTKKAIGKSSSTGNGHQFNEIEEEDMPHKNNSKLKSKRKNNKVIDDSEEEKVKGLFIHQHNNSDVNHGSGLGFNANNLNSAKGVSNPNATSLQNDPSTASSTSSSYSGQQQNMNSNSNSTNGSNGAKNSVQSTNLSNQNFNNKVMKIDNMVIETDDDEEEEGGAIAHTKTQFIRSSLGNSTDKQNKISNIPQSKLDETLAKYQPFNPQLILEEKGKQTQIQAKTDSSIQNQQQKVQNLSLKKQQSQEQKQNNPANVEQMRNIRSKQSSFVSNQQQVIEEEDDNSENDDSSPLNSNEIKIEEVEEDSKVTSNKNRLNNESSQVRENSSDEEDRDSDSENNSNQRLTRASKRKQIRKSKSSIYPANNEKIIKGTTGKSMTNSLTVSSITTKKGRITRSKTQNVKGKKIKGKASSLQGTSITQNKQHTFLRTRSTMKTKEPSVTIKNVTELNNDFPTVRTRKGSLRSQHNNAFYSESSMSHTSPHPSNSVNSVFLYQDQVLNLDDEFNQLFSHLQSMTSLDYSDTFKVLEDIIQKIKNHDPKIENVIGILGSDNGKLLLCAKNLIFSDNSINITQTSVSPQRINELKEELDCLIDTLQALLVKRFFDHEEKLRLLKTVNCSSSKIREIEELEKVTQKTSPKGKKTDIDNFANQMSSSSSSSSVRPRKQSSSQQIKEKTSNQPQQFSLQSKDSSEISIPTNSNAEKEPVVEQSLVSLIQMQSEASIKLAQSTPIYQQHQQSSHSQKISNCIDSTLISTGSLTLNTSQSYTLGAIESLENKPPRYQNSEQNYTDKMIDEQSEGKCDKENNINNLTEDQKLMRRKICLKIIKPLIKILKDQAQAQNYAKNIEIMIRQKYPAMCTEYKNICKNLITLINQTDFHTTPQRIESYLNSHNPEQFKVLQENQSSLNDNGNCNGENSNTDMLKNAVNYNDESNNSHQTNRTPISRKFSTLSNKMDEERYDNSSESCVNHDGNNQSQSGEDKPAIFEEYSSNTRQQQHKIIVDEEDDEEEVQVQPTQQLNPTSMHQSPAKSQIENSRKNSLLPLAEEHITVMENEFKEEIQKEEIDEKENIEKMEVEENPANPVGEDIKKEKEESEQQEQEIKLDECKSPQKIDNVNENEDSNKIQVEDDDEEEEEIGISQQVHQQQNQDQHTSPQKNHQQTVENIELPTQQQESSNTDSTNYNLQIPEGLESNQENETSSNKPSSAVKNPNQEVENESSNIEASNKIIYQTTISNEYEVNNEDAQKGDKTDSPNKDMNESSTTPLLCENPINTNTAPSLLTEQ